MVVLSVNKYKHKLSGWRANMASDYITLIKEATEIFNKDFGSAVLFAAEGAPKDGVAKKSSDLQKWLFLAKPNGSNDVMQLNWEDGNFTAPFNIGPWYGLITEQLPQGTVTLDQAIDILNKQGYTSGFLNCSMGTPVVENPEPMFWFCINAQIQGVSARTGKIYRNLFPCQGYGMIGLKK
jgi:hypothetical protein